MIVCSPREEQALHIGICLPAVCSPAKIGNKIGDIIESMIKNVTFRIYDGTCQTSKNPISPITTADWISM